jgi:hypothetical protein
MGAFDLVPARIDGVLDDRGHGDRDAASPGLTRGNWAPAAAQRSPGGGGGESGPVIRELIVDGAAARYRIDLYVQVSNLFNTTNLNKFVGNRLSEYFGRATSAGAPRRIEIGASVSF